MTTDDKTSAERYRDKFGASPDGGSIGKARKTRGRA